jgi:hypothetical protein
MLVGKPEEKKLHGRSSRTWGKYNIIEELKEMYEAVIWIHQIWNSFQRLVIVNTGNE